MYLPQNRVEYNGIKVFFVRVNLKVKPLKVDRLVSKTIANVDKDE
jgi:hypothetical protein